MSDFVTPEQVRLSLKGSNRTIDVKKRLSHGEREKMNEGMYEAGQFRPRKVRTAIVTAYLLGWSLTDGGKAVPYGIADEDRASAIDNLDPDTFDEIYLAIDTHVAEVQAARDAEKNAQDGKLASTATSPFVS